MTPALALALAALLASAPDDYDAVLRDVGQVQPLVLATRMEAWAQANPGDVRLGQALLWSAQQRLRSLDREGGRRTLERLLATTPQSPAVPDAELLLADLDVEAHDFDAALVRYDRVQTAGDERLRYLASEHRREALSARVRFIVAWLVGGLMALAAALRLWRAWRGRTLWPLPDEAWRALPVALLLAAASFAQPVQERQAVLTVCVLGFALTWVTGAAWSARAPRGGRRYAEAAVAVAEAGGVLFLAIESSRLWSRVVDTFAQGAQ